MTLSIFKKIITLACFTIIMIVLVACGNNQTADVPAVDESTEVETPTQDVLTVQQARDMLDDVFPDGGTITYRAMQDRTEGDIRFYAFEVNTADDSRVYALAFVNSVTGAVDVEMVEEEAAYSAELLELREAMLGYWHVYQQTNEWLVGGEAIEFLADGTGREIHGDGWELAFTWSVEEIDHAYQNFRLTLTSDVHTDFFRFVQMWYGELMLFQDAGPPLIFSKDDPQVVTQQPVPQVSPMEARRAAFEAELVGTWAVSAADNEWFIGTDTVRFSAGGTGLQGTTDFRWHVDIVERPHLPDGDYLVLVVYIPEFGFTEEFSFPEIQNNFLSLSDYTGMEWAELIRE